LFDLTFTDVHTDRQKLSPILESKVVQKFKFLKNENKKTTAPKLIFFNEKNFRKIRTLFDCKN
jgi:hypothetical protein